MKENKTRLIAQFDDFRPYGINFLTGESCAYSMRGLCDLSQQGVDLLIEFFGGSMTFREGSNWNSKVGNDLAIASVLLAHAILPDLGKYILFSVENYRYVMQCGDEMLGFSDQETLDKYNELSERAPNMGIRIYNNIAWRQTTVIGGRNIHAFSGRTV